MAMNWMLVVVILAIHLTRPAVSQGSIINYGLGSPRIPTSSITASERQDLVEFLSIDSSGFWATNATSALVTVDLALPYYVSIIELAPGPGGVTFGQINVTYDHDDVSGVAVQGSPFSGPTSGQKYAISTVLASSLSFALSAPTSADAAAGIKIELYGPGVLTLSFALGPLPSYVTASTGASVVQSNGHIVLQASNVTIEYDVLQQLSGSAGSLWIYVTWSSSDSVTYSASVSGRDTDAGFESSIISGQAAASQEFTTSRFLVPINQPLSHFSMTLSLAAASGTLDLYSILVAEGPLDCASVLGSAGSSANCTFCDGVSGYADQVGLASCKPVSTCNTSTSYITATPTYTSDRDCDLLTTCLPHQYEQDPPAVSADRTCANCTTTCAGSEYLAGECEPTGSTDYVCTACSSSVPNCSSCGRNGTGVACSTCEGPLLLLDNTCVEDCPDGTVPLSGRCEPCASPCTWCAGSQTQCTACANSAFVPGLTDVGAFTFLEDETCVANCRSGSFGNLTSGSCQPLSPACNASTEYELTAASRTGDRTCAAVTDCQPGFFQDAAPNATANRRCLPCANGTYIADVNGNASMCVTCAAGTSDEDEDASTPCTPCGAGTHTAGGVAGNCSAYACAAGTTDDDFNASTPCVACDAGAFAASGSSGPCANLTCAAGTVDDDSNSTTPCKSCSVGGYAASGTVGACTTCGAGEKDLDLDPATPCEPCPPGTYDDMQTNTTCAPCAQGLFSSEPGSLECSPCFNCVGSFYIAANCSADSDTDCRSCETCAVSAVAVPCSTYADTICVAPSSSDEDKDISVSTFYGLFAVLFIILVLVALHFACAKRHNQAVKRKTRQLSQFEVASIPLEAPPSPRDHPRSKYQSRTSVLTDVEMSHMETPVPIGGINAWSSEEV